MEVQTCLDQKDWVEHINQWVANRAQKYCAGRLFVPAGQTPVPLYAEWETNRPEYLRNLQLVQIDEVLNHPPLFRPFFKQHLPSYLGQMEFIDQANLTGDLALLGLGTNGHVAFHEPGLPADFVSGCVLLHEATCRRLGLATPSWGVTYGVGTFLNTRAVAMIIRGSEKRDIVKRVVAGDQSLPAGHLIAHPDLTLFLDFAL